MKYLNKTIKRVVLIDVFTVEEREKTEFKVTENLDRYLTENNIITNSYFPNSITEFDQIFQEIINLDNGVGLIIHLNSHGAQQAVSFGNNNFSVEWNHLYKYLRILNENTNDGLIMNTSIMCYGINIFQLIKYFPKPFYAAIGSKTENSLQALDHNKEIYKKCLKSDVAAQWLQAVNNNFEEIQYELKFA